MDKILNKTFSLEEKVYNDLNNNFNSPFVVQRGAMFCRDDKIAFFDIVIKKDNKELAIVEVKKNFRNNNDTNTIYYAKYLSSINIEGSKPCFCITDGNNYYILENGISDSYELNQFVERVVNGNEASINYNKNTINTFLNDLYTVFKKNQNNKMMEYALSLKKDFDSYGFDEVFEKDGKHFFFKEAIEIKFFKKLLNVDGKIKNKYKDLYRYTSLKSLFRIINDGKQSMSSIIGMNDVSECYFSNKEKKDCFIKSTQTNTLKKFEDVDYIFEDGDCCFVTSCVTDDKEKLFMWYMYGDQGRGVRIHYRLIDDKMPENFVVAPINYSDNNNYTIIDSLEELEKEHEDCLSFKFKRKNAWCHFFKPNEFSEENEIRILYFDESDYRNNNSIDWIINENFRVFPIIQFPLQNFVKQDDEINAVHFKSQDFEKECSKVMTFFPYKIVDVMLGPKCPFKDMNYAMIKKMSNKKESKSCQEPIDFIVSKIETFK